MWQGEWVWVNYGKAGCDESVSERDRGERETLRGERERERARKKMSFWQDDIARFKVLRHHLFA